MSYESPIELRRSDDITDNLTLEIMRKQEDAIEQAIFETVTMRYEINVNKEELVKALHYDRTQYFKGYYDGYSEGLAAGRKEAIDAIIKAIGGKTAPAAGEKED